MMAAAAEHQDPHRTGLLQQEYQVRLNCALNNQQTADIGKHMFHRNTRAAFTAYPGRTNIVLRPDGQRRSTRDAGKDRMLKMPIARMALTAEGPKTAVIRMAITSTGKAKTRSFPRITRSSSHPPYVAAALAQEARRQACQDQPPKWPPPWRFLCPPKHGQKITTKMICSKKVCCAWYVGALQ